MAGEGVAREEALAAGLLVPFLPAEAQPENSSAAARLRRPATQPRQRLWPRSQAAGAAGRRTGGRSSRSGRASRRGRSTGGPGPLREKRRWRACDNDSRQKRVVGSYDIPTEEWEALTEDGEGLMTLERNVPAAVQAPRSNKVAEESRAARVTPAVAAPGLVRGSPGSWRRPCHGQLCGRLRLEEAAGGVLH